jgi:hypothetical protein
VVANNGGDKKIGFIDFGLSFFYEETQMSAEQVRDPLSYVHCLHSVWEIEGKRSSYRDDVFRALMILPMLIHGNIYIEFCKKLEYNIVNMYWYKKQSFIFDFSYAGSSYELPIADMDKKSAIRAKLAAVIDSVRDIDDIGQKPDYTIIINNLATIIGILNH